MDKIIMLDETPLLIKARWGMSLEEALKHIDERKEKEDEKKKAEWLQEERF